MITRYLHTTICPSHSTKLTSAIFYPIFAPYANLAPKYSSWVDLSFEAQQIRIMVPPECVLVVWLFNICFVDIASCIWRLISQDLSQSICRLLCSCHLLRRAFERVGYSSHWIVASTSAKICKLSSTQTDGFQTNGLGADVYSLTSNTVCLHAGFTEL